MSAPLRGVFSTPGSQFDFKVINLVPLGVGSLAIRYLKKLLQALTGRKGLRCTHVALAFRLRPRADLVLPSAITVTRSNRVGLHVHMTVSMPTAYRR